MVEAVGRTVDKGATSRSEGFTSLAGGEGEEWVDGELAGLDDSLGSLESGRGGTIRGLDEEEEAVLSESGMVVEGVLGLAVTALEVDTGEGEELGADDADTGAGLCSSSGSASMGGLLPLLGGEDLIMGADSWPRGLEAAAAEDMAACDSKR